MLKQTKLNDDAHIYQTRKALTEKEKLGDMRLREKLSYLWAYYKIHAVITIAVITLSISIIHIIATPDIKTQFYAAFINSSMDEAVMEDYRAQFSEFLQLDPKTEKVEFNNSFHFNADPQYTMNMKQILSTYFMAEQIDVIIAPESEFASYAYYEYLVKLSDQLPTDIYSSLTDHFYLSALENDSKVNVYGIYLTNTNLYPNSEDNSDPYVLGIAINSKHKENAIEFIRYLFKSKTSKE